MPAGERRSALLPAFGAVPRRFLESTVQLGDLGFGVGGLLW